MAMSKPKPGGLRNPAGGRPRMEPSERKVKVNWTIDPDVITWLEGQRQRPKEPISTVANRELKRAATDAAEGKTQS